MDVGRFSKKFSFLCQFSIILSDFVMLNFVAIHKDINTTPGTSEVDQGQKLAEEGACKAGRPADNICGV